MASAVSDNAPRSRFAITPAWVVALGMALLAVPTIATLGEQVWSKESGAHGPIVLVTGLWLLWRKRDEMLAAAAPGSDWLTIPAMAASLALYIFGRAYDFISLEVVGLYGVGVDEDGHLLLPVAHRTVAVAEDAAITLHPAEAVVDVAGDGHVSDRPSGDLRDRHPVHAFAKRGVVEGLVDHEDVDVAELLLELEVARVLQ